MEESTSQCQSEMETLQQENQELTANIKRLNFDIETIRADTTNTGGEIELLKKQLGEEKLKKIQVSNSKVHS